MRVSERLELNSRIEITSVRRDAMKRRFPGPQHGVADIDRDRIRRKGHRAIGTNIDVDRCRQSRRSFQCNHGRHADSPSQNTLHSYPLACGVFPPEQLFELVSVLASMEK